jgi:hypothetical protein
VSADGFAYVVRKNGDVVITHHGRPAGTLRAEAAIDFLAEVQAGDPQGVMARATGNYKHGNERQARQHLRNRSRGVDARRA